MRIYAFENVVVEFQRRHNAGREVLDYDVGFAHEAQTSFATSVALEVQSDGTLAGVEVQKDARALDRRLILEERSLLPRRVARFRAFDFYHVSAVVSQEFC